MPLGTVISWCLELYTPLAVGLSLCIRASAKSSSLVLWEEKSSWAKEHKSNCEALLLPNPLSITWLLKVLINTEMFVGSGPVAVFLITYLCLVDLLFFQHFIQAPSRTARRFVKLCPGLYVRLPKCFPLLMWQARPLITH